jgi:PadR family transcriptional regulator PadR
MEFSQDLVRGSIVPIILALLKQRAMYGYEIVKVVNARTGGRFEWKEGTLYPALHRLQAEGLIGAKWVEAPSVTPGAGNDRQRKYYSLTGRGRRELERRATEWRQFAEAVNALLMGA